MNSTCLIQLRVFTLFITALIASGAALAQAQAPTTALDVIGIKIGMPVKDAVAAIKADNPKLTLENLTLLLEGFDQPFLTSVLADEPGLTGKDKEGFELLFTTPPNEQVVWGIRRTYSYADQNKPSLDNTLAGLRKKYGPESVFVNPDPRDLTKNMAWVYDAQGKLIAPAAAKGLYLACDSYLGNDFGGGPGLRNDLAGAVHAPAQCDSIILATASVQASVSVIAGATVVTTLMVRIANGPMYRASIDATRAVANNAARAREKKTNDDVNKRGAPKL